MALVPLATKGNYFHVYDFRVRHGRGDDFVELFNKFDYGDNNPFHRSRAQVKDGVLCRDTVDPDHFYLIGEWADIEEHRRIRVASRRPNPRRDLCQLISTRPSGPFQTAPPISQMAPIRPRRAAPSFLSIERRRASHRALRCGWPACAGRWRRRHGSRERPCIAR
jgi:hypothetical protein